MLLVNRSAFSWWPKTDLLLDDQTKFILLFVIPFACLYRRFLLRATSFCLVGRNLPVSSCLLQADEAAGKLLALCALVVSTHTLFPAAARYRVRILCVAVAASAPASVSLRIRYFVSEQVGF